MPHRGLRLLRSQIPREDSALGLISARRDDVGLMLDAEGLPKRVRVRKSPTRL
jgi:hypothetical protein